MSPFSAVLRDKLVALQQHDLELRAELEADGVLFDGYHPRMQAVHRDNARQLRVLIEQYGWPNEHLASADGAEAAWLVAQHAIAEPTFMRRCRELIEKEVAAGAVPYWQFAYLDDRIRVSEGKPQRFGTQFEMTPDGPVLCEVDDPPALNQRRRDAGIGSIEERMNSLRDGPRPTASEYAARKAAEMRWRLEVGWTAPAGA